MSNERIVAFIEQHITLIEKQIETNNKTSVFDFSNAKVTGSHFDSNIIEGDFGKFVNAENAEIQNSTVNNNILRQNTDYSNIIKHYKELNQILLKEPIEDEKKKDWKETVKNKLTEIVTHYAKYPEVIFDVSSVWQALQGQVGISFL